MKQWYWSIRALLKEHWKRKGGNPAEAFRGMPPPEVVTCFMTWPGFEERR